MAGNVTPINGGKKPRKAPAKRAPKKPPAKELVLAPERGAREYELHREGHSWQEIGKQLSMSPKHAMAASQAYLQKAALEMEADQRQRALSLEVERLNNLQSKYWPAATAGDLDAARYVLSIIQTRIKALRLDEEAETGAVRTVVVAGTNAQYVATLKQLLNEEESVEAELVEDE